MKLAFFALFSAICPCSIWGQIAQSHPEYCGIPGGLNPTLPNISATIDQEGYAVLYTDRGDSATGIRLDIGTLPISISQIAEVCPLADGRLVVFADYGATYIYIIDTKKPSRVDSFAAWDAAISPDQRWITFVKIYPLHGVEGSNEFMIYDLRRSPAQNRPEGIEGDTDVGRVIYPPGQLDFPGSNIGLPKDQQHLGGRGLYWSSDSRALLFEDTVASGPGIALVTLDEKGTPSAFRYPLTRVETCGRDLPTTVSHMWKLERAEIGAEVAGNRTITLDIGVWGDNRCGPHILQLRKDDFQPATKEVHAKPEITRGMIFEGREVRSPKKKQ